METRNQSARLNSSRRPSVRSISSRSVGGSVVSASADPFENRTAAVGWIAGHPLPIVIALIIAAVDGQNLVATL